MSAHQSAQREVTIVDLQIQNIQSVENAFRTVGARVKVATDAAAIEGAEFLVLPGVGSFSAAATRLRIGSLRQAIRRHALEKGRPVLGLCLGMQLLADSSEEHGLHDGLGLIPGRVVRLQEAPPDFRVPNVGWRQVRFRPGAEGQVPSALDGRSFYHVHSFHFLTKDPAHTVGISRFGDGDIASIVRNDHVVGTQFHPEKSQEAGLDLLHALLQQLH
jgi:imidazole glycerol-phosphate synthase subunit HisH